MFGLIKQVNERARQEVSLTLSMLQTLQDHVENIKAGASDVDQVLALIQQARLDTIQRQSEQDYQVWTNVLEVKQEMDDLMIHASPQKRARE
jgi:cell division protein FtsB